MTDYYSFCERYAQRCAARRAETEEAELLLRRSREFRQRDMHEQSEPSPQPQQSSGDEMLVYKTYYAPAQQQSNVMDPITEAAWNSWADRKIEDALKWQAEWMKNSIAEALVLERQAMREELGLLKAEVEVLRSVIKSQNVGVI